MIWNNDPRSQLTDPQYLTLLAATGVCVRMDSTSRAQDSIFTECLCLWRTCSDEEVYLHDYVSSEEVRQGLAHYFAFYLFR